MNRNESFTSSILSAAADAASTSTWYALRTSADGGTTPLVDIRGDGFMEVHQGGANITGLVSLHTGLDVLAGGIDVLTGGLVV